MSTPPTPPRPKVVHTGDITIITLGTGATRAAESALARDLGGLTAGAIGRHLLIDFARVEYLNSTDLGTLISLHKRCEAAGGRLTLFNLSAPVYKLFTVTRLDTLLEIWRDAPAAVPDPPASSERA